MSQLTDKPLVIATRKSPLALWQAEHVKLLLETAHPGLEVRLLAMSTQGDKILDTPLAKIGGKGLFVKELEAAMLRGDADIAVHSMKDVPMELPEGLCLTTYIPREDIRDAFVSNQYASLGELPEGARVGTSSLRRQAQIKAIRPDLELLDCRGNVGTRLAKLDAGEYEAIILASAGLIRLEMPERIRAFIEPEEILPAAGQGAIGIERRDQDPRLEALLAPLNDSATEYAVRAERAMNKHLEGGCQVPIGALTHMQDGSITLRGMVADLSGHRLFEEQTDSLENVEQLGISVAEGLLKQGADRILSELSA